MTQEISNYRFQVADLKVASRQPGISAFMRVRNGADFLRQTVESHLPYFDEIVIVFNQCEDDTAAIAASLEATHPEKVRSYHYVDRVYPVGHREYATLADDSPHAMANYYNFALAMTRFTVATKLDDDHLAIPEPLARLTSRIVDMKHDLRGTMLCISGLNLCKSDEGIRILQPEPYSGNGDIGYFNVTASTLFVNGVRHERFQRGGLRRLYAGLTYLHCKYLKKGHGFTNYEIGPDAHPRYGRKLRRFLNNRKVVSIRDFIGHGHWLRWIPLPSSTPAKWRLRRDRARELASLVDPVEIERVIERWLEPR